MTAGAIARERRRKRAAVAFSGLIVTLAIVSVTIPDRLKAGGFQTPGSESARSTQRLHQALGYDPEPGMVVLARSRQPISEPGPSAAVAAVAAQLTADPGVGSVQTFFGRGGLRVLRSRDGRAALILVHPTNAGELEAAPVIDRLRAQVHSGALQLRYGGFDVGFLDDNRVVREDLLRAELIAFPLLALLLIAAFRGFRAAVLPLAIGGLSVLGTFAGLRLLSQVIDVSVYSLNLASALGLGLAVDYGLFLVSRYREESAARGVGHEAIAATMQSAGRAVLFSGATVAGACAALALFPQQFIYSMGIGGVLTAVLAAGAAFVVVPALLPFVGRGAPAAARPGGGWWYRFSGWVMRRAVAVAVLSAVAITAAGIPATGVRLTFLDSKALPPGLESRTVADAIAHDFVPYLDFPISVAVGRSTVARPGALADLPAQIASLPGAGLVSQVQRAPDGSGLIQLLPRSPPLSGTSERLIAELRQLRPPLLVGGRVADFVDLKASIRAHALPALALVAAATLIVLFLMTDSVVLPLKALLMNALTLSAVFGLLVAIFQDGLLGIPSLLGFQGPPALETTMSVVVVGVTLGLATDYSILLLSRIKEEHDAGEPNTSAVALGLERSGRVITNAALLLAVALIALASSRVFVVQELAVGLVIGVGFDATIVRACLVPSLMKILGQLNWWAPRALHRLRASLRRLAVGRIEPPSAFETEPLTEGPASAE